MNFCFISHVLFISGAQCEVLLVHREKQCCVLLFTLCQAEGRWAVEDCFGTFSDMHGKLSKPFILHCSDSHLEAG